MASNARGVKALVAILGGSGVIHFLKPGFYEKIVPPQVGDARTVVYVSGVAELACAGLLAVPRTRRLGGWLAAGLFVGVFPANLHAVKIMPGKAGKIGAIARLPFQIPMITTALKIARDS